MKPFDIEAAGRGEPVVTRDGRQVRILCTDRVADDGFPVVALVGDEQWLGVFLRDGISMASRNLELFMAPKKRVLWRRLVRNSEGGYRYDVVTADEYASGHLYAGFADTTLTNWEPFEVEE